MVYLYTSVHHHIYACRCQKISCFRIFYAQLHPEHFCFQTDCLLSMGHNLCRVPEYIDKIHRLFDMIKCLIGLFAKNLLL